MRPDLDRSQRRAAAAFLALMAPLAVAIASSGGIVALMPLLLLLVPILVTGRVPGLAALGAAIRPRSLRGPSRLGVPGFAHPLAFRLRRWLVSGPAAGRGPPLGV